MTVRIGINGMGRIGKSVLRAQLGDSLYAPVEIVAINDVTPLPSLAHLLKYDSIMGRFPGEIHVRDQQLLIRDRPITVGSYANPQDIPWREWGVDYVVEATGRFTHLAGASGHLQGGARRVIISAPGGEEVKTLVMGVNHQEYDPALHRVVSNASCTTNCLAQLVHVLHGHFGIRHGFMTTVHSYTNGQPVHDLPQKDLRRSRAAGMSMIPTTTGAGRALGWVLPQLAGKIETLSIRVPTPNVSLVDLVVEVEKTASSQQVNALLQASADRYLGYSDEPLVSVDYLQDPHSCIVDALCTRTTDHTLKVVGWYDNEWGYSCRVLDLILHMAGLESP
ncbi:MAG: type I glyceraldehyde-3-phosphate dehydrogenase [Magnetococcales bacterium]|nr:type I glyceraldehyde-3-phosphate dehydrogenase [Magnetococcales bacterium]NGZ25624.1 type I glyceraldehyde-3-phosphate dehydrogenase [Magnetococcales bacterium]